MLQSKNFAQVAAIFAAGLLLLLAIALGLGVAGVFSNGVSILAGQRSPNLGVEAGKLLPCPETPNCVSSQAREDIHGIAALTYVGKPEQAIADLKEIVESFPKAKVISRSDRYLYAEFTSTLMGFVDDVEFYVTSDGIQVRSASRLGESDLGVNRRRVEAIRAKLQQQTNETGSSGSSAL